MHTPLTILPESGDTPPLAPSSATHTTERERRYEPSPTKTTNKDRQPYPAPLPLYRSPKVGGAPPERGCIPLY